jgi:hypothetical protein
MNKEHVHNGALDFNDGDDADSEYRYDGNGALIQDKNSMNGEPYPVHTSRNIYSANNLAVWKYVCIFAFRNA